MGVWRQADGNRMAVQVSRVCGGVRGLAARACGRGRAVCVRAGVRLQPWECRESAAPAMYRVSVVSWYLGEHGQRTLPSSESSSVLFNLKRPWSEGVFNHGV